MQSKGFGLLELIISMVIIAILAGISYPLYQQHIIKTRRIEAKTALYEIAQRLEQYYMAENSYQGATLALLKLSEFTEHHYYRLTITTQEQGKHYQISAMPQGMQAEQDKSCGTFIINDIGQQGITGTDSANDCWS